MANPTAQVPVSSTAFEEEKVYWPANPALTADTTFTGEMMGMRADTGFAEHFDDAAPKIFLGTKEQIVSRFQSDTPATDFKYLIRRPKLFEVPLNTAVTATATIPGSIGLPAYASDSGHVQLSLGALVNGNLAGMVVDISRTQSVGNVGGLLALSTANTTPAVVVAPPQFGALAGLVAVGFAGADSGTVNGTAAPNLLINTGRGGNGTAGVVNGGAGAQLVITCGAGGTSVGGAGGIVMGNPTGGHKGCATINLATGGGVFLNNSAYANPDYVFEKFFTGNVARFAAEPGAREYDGPLSVAQTEAYARANLHLPGMDHGHDLFRRAAFTLEKLEEAWIALFNHEKRLAALEGA